MSIAANNTFTLGELAKIALGGTELTSEQLGVFQSLLIILLQKLDCHNETVKFSGFPAKCIKNLLNDKPNCGQFGFTLKAVRRLKDKFQLIEELERKTKEMDMKIDHHFSEIHRCNKTFAFAAHKWDFYASPTEDLCTLYMTHNREFCLLARNPAFNREIQFRISPLVTDKLTKLEFKLETIQERLQKISTVADKMAPHIKGIDFLLEDIQDMSSLLSQEKKTFRDTMLEIQEMLNCKLLRVTVPSLKRYLDRRFSHIWEKLKILNNVSVVNKCNRLKPLTIEVKKTCLSCSPCQDHCDQPTNSTLNIKEEENRGSCIAKTQSISLIDTINKFETSRDQLKKGNTSKLLCAASTSKIKLR